MNSRRNSWWNGFGALLQIIVSLLIFYNYVFRGEEPSPILVYAGLLLYMEVFLKHKDIFESTNKDN